jgi:hypothetical protein
MSTPEATREPPSQTRSRIRKLPRAAVSAGRTRPANPLKTGEIPPLTDSLNEIDRVMMAEGEGLVSNVLCFAFWLII